MDSVTENAGQRSGFDSRFTIKSEGRVVFLSLDEIDWIEAAANYIKLSVGGQPYRMREAISRLAQRLDSSQFVRIHRSTIVNVRRIKALEPVNSGEYIVILRDGKELSCSRSYRAGLKPFIGRTL
jgi:two-component system, LytTR family, response regulator